MTVDPPITRKRVFSQHRHGLMQAVTFVLVGSLALSPHFILGEIFGFPGFGGIVVLSLAAPFISAELTFAVLILLLFMQNTFIAIFVRLATGMDEFVSLLATSALNIAITSVMCAPMWLRMRDRLPADNKKLLYSVVLLLMVIAAYTALGAASASVGDALLYARVYLVGLFLLIIGVALGFQIPLSYTVNVIRVMAFLLVAWGLAEFFFSRALYTLFNIAEYMRFKYETDLFSGFYSVQSVIEFASRSYLNLSGSFGLQTMVLRPMGPNVHPISYAYALAFCSIICFIYRYNILTFLCLFLLVIVGAKGPLIMGFVSIGLYFFYSMVRNPRWLIGVTAAFMILYVSVGIVYGNYTQDYHVIGLMGGVHGFFSNPIGRGIGVGGNLSTLANTQKNFQLFQNYGASFALESAFGVMIYQIGVCSFFFFLFYWRLWKNTWKAAMYYKDSQPRLVALPLALAMLLVNTVFQEESLSPAGWGPFMLFSGLLLAELWREQAKIKADAGEPKLEIPSVF